MAKKRTGLQSEIAGIFSGVPVPKKGGPRSQPGVPAQKPSGSVIPKPVAPQPQVPLAPMPKKPVEPLPAAPRPKVVKVKVPGQKTRQIPQRKLRRRKDKLFAPKAGVSSSRQKSGIILFLLLSTVLVIVLARPYLKSRRNPATSSTAGKMNTNNSTMANFEIDWPVPPVYSAKLRDPMELGLQQQIEPETPYDIIVKGITYSEDRKIAVIGTQTMREGDVVLGATIVQINLSSVVFERDGERFTKKVEGEQK